jgi:hypothetical protein
MIRGLFYHRQPEQKFNFLSARRFLAGLLVSLKKARK